MCDKCEGCENFKTKEKFKWEGMVEWHDAPDGHVYPYSGLSRLNQENLSGKTTRITIEEV